MSRREAILRFIAGLFGGQVAAFALLAMFWSTEGIHPKDVMYSIVLFACFGLLPVLGYCSAA